MEIYIKAESIWEIEEMKLTLEVWGYDWKIYIIPTEKLRKQLMENKLVSDISKTAQVQQIMWIEVFWSLIV